jgi:hypothetical protein
VVMTLGGSELATLVAYARDVERGGIQIIR